MPVVIDGTNGISGVDGTAASPAIEGTDSNTGVFFPAADTVAVTTGGTERMRIDSSGNFQFNSGYGSVATAYGCRAWVNFNGTGTVAIRASGNVSSITDNGTGDYTVNFTTAMADANYSFHLNLESNVTTVPRLASARNGGVAVSSLRLIAADLGATLLDLPTLTVAVFR